MGSNTDKPTQNSNSGATRAGFCITGRNTDSRKEDKTPPNRGKGSKKR